MSTWRAAGLTYNKYVSICAVTARNCVKETLRKKYAPQNVISYKKIEYTPDGKNTGKVIVTTPVI